MVLAVSVMGVFAVSSANESYETQHIMGLAMGFFLAIIISFVNYSFVLKFKWPIYILNIILLLITYTSFGHSANNAQRWIKIGGFTLQPSETAKIMLILFLAQYIMLHRKTLNKWYRLALIVVLMAIPTYLIFNQPDLSTTLVVCVIAATIIFIGGLSWKYILVICSLVPVMLIVVFIAIQPESTLLEDYQKNRILALLSPEDFPETSRQQINSVKAIASGQLEGKGYKNDDVTSVKNGKYILEPQTDFIFAVIGEEFGFVGSLVVIGSLFAIVFECLYTAYKAKDLAGRLIATGVGAWIGFQTFFNIGVCTFILPNTGLPLPFISYGLNSIVSLYIGIGFVLNIKLQQRKYGEVME